MEPINPSSSNDNLDDTDWDNEFGLAEEIEEAKQLNSGFRHLISLSEVPSFDEDFSDRSIMEPLSSIPTNSKFFSRLMEEQKNSSYSNKNTNFELYSLHLEKQRIKKLEAEEIKDLLDIIRQIGHESLNKHDESFHNFIWFKRRTSPTFFTLQFTKDWLEWILYLFKQHAHELLKSIKLFIVQLKAYVNSRSQLNKNIKLSSAEHLQMFRNIRDMLFIIILCICRDAIKDKLRRYYNEMSKYTEQLFPEYVHSLVLMKLRLTAHLLAASSEYPRLSLVDLPAFPKELSARWQSTTESKKKTTMMLKLPCLLLNEYANAFRKIYAENVASPSTASSVYYAPESSFEILAAIVSDVYLIITGVNPYTMSHAQIFNEAYSCLERDSSDEEDVEEDMDVLGVIYADNPEGDAESVYDSDIDGGEAVQDESLGIDPPLVDAQLSSASMSSGHHRLSTKSSGDIPALLGIRIRSSSYSPSDDSPDSTTQSVRANAPPSSPSLSTSQGQSDSLYSTSASGSSLGSSRMKHSHSSGTRNINMNAKKKILLKRNAQIIENIMRGERLSQDGKDLVRLLKVNIIGINDYLLLRYHKIETSSIYKVQIALVLGMIGSSLSASDFISKVRSDKPQSAYTESLFMEAVFLSSSLPLHDKILKFTLCAFTVEKLGEVIISRIHDKSKRYKPCNGYRLGLMCLEAAVQLNENLKYPLETRRLYRRLAVLSQDHNDVAKSLYYHTKILQLAKTEENLNEFVFIANVVSTLFLDLGEAQLAESCLRLTSYLLGGLPMNAVRFEHLNVTEMEYHQLPEGLVVPVLVDGQCVLPPVWRLTPPSPQEVPVTVDASQLEIMLKIVNIMVITGQFDGAVTICQLLLSKRLDILARANIFLTLAKLYLKMRKLSYCEAALDRLTAEGEEALVAAYERRTDTLSDHSKSSHTLNSMVSSGGQPRLTTSLPVDQERLLPISVSAIVSKQSPVEHMILRAKCRMFGKDFDWAVRWLKIAVVACPLGLWSQQGKVNYLLGCAYQQLCLGCQVGGIVPAESVFSEAEFAELSELHFRIAFTYYKQTDDVLHQLKTITGLVRLHVNRLFCAVSYHGLDPTTSLGGKGGEILQVMEAFTTANLESAGDTASPMTLLNVLVNCSELSWLQGKASLACSAWREAFSLLCVSYLQPESSPPVSDTNTLSHSSSSSLLPLPLQGVMRPTTKYSPGLLIRIYELQTRLVRLAFLLKPPPLCHLAPLLTSWIHMEALTEATRTPIFPNQIDSNTVITVGFFKNNLQPSHIFDSTPAADSSGLDGSVRNWLTRFLTILPQSQRLASMSGSVAMSYHTTGINVSEHLSRPVIPKHQRKPSRTSLGKLRQQSLLFPELVAVAVAAAGQRPFTAQLTSTQSISMHSDSFHHLENTEVKSQSPSQAAAVTDIVNSMAVLLTPFEVVRRSLLVQAVQYSDFELAAQTARDIMTTLQSIASVAVADPQGHTADVIRVRASFPGVCLTPTGGVVEGVGSTREAERDSRQSQSSTRDRVEVSSNTSSSTKNNTGSTTSQYQRMARREMSKVTSPPLVLGDSPKVGQRSSATSSLPRPPSTKNHRIEILFLRLRLNERKYVDYRDSLQDLCSNNMRVLHYLVDRLVPDSLRNMTEVVFNTRESLEDTLTATATATPAVEAAQAVRRPIVLPFLYGEQNKEDVSNAKYIMQSFEDRSTNLAYPPSYRIAITIDNTILHHQPYYETFSVIVLPPPAPPVSLPKPSPPLLSSSRSKTVSFHSEIIQDISNTKNQSIKATTEVFSALVDDEETEDEVIEKEFEYRHQDTRPSYTFPTTDDDDDIVQEDEEKIRARIKREDFLRFQYSDEKKSESQKLTGILRQQQQHQEQSVVQAAGRCLGLLWQASPSPSQQRDIDASLLTLLDALPAVLPDEVTDQGEGLDDCVAVLVSRLGLTRVLLVVNALLLQEAVMVVISPGEERVLLQVLTGLLRLIRPLRWLHLYVPLMHTGFRTILKMILKHQRPFLIGAYRNVLGGGAGASMETGKAGGDGSDLQDTASSSISNLSQESYCVPGELLKDVTIVYLDTGTLRPGRNIQFAAYCTISESITPESSPPTLEALLNDLHANKDPEWRVELAKPPLPARYRYSLWSRLQRLLAVETDLSTTSKKVQTEGNKQKMRPPALMSSSSSLTDDSATINFPKGRGGEVTVETGRIISEWFFSLLVSLLKGLSICPMLLLTETSVDGEEDQRKQEDEDRFLSLLKDDVQPFVRQLIRTEAFSQLIRELSTFRELVQSLQDEQTMTTVSPLLRHFFTSCSERMKQRLQIHTTVSSKRYTGILKISIIQQSTKNDVSDPSSNLVYQFPYQNPVDEVTSPMRSLINIFKRKTRCWLWCVMDARRFTYYRAQSRSTPKGYIDLNPETTTLICSPSYRFETTLTTDDDCFALVDGETRRVIVLRAENRKEHNEWIQGIRSHFIKPEIIDRMSRL